MREAMKWNRPAMWKLRMIAVVGVLLLVSCSGFGAPRTSAEGASDSAEQRASSADSTSGFSPIVFTFDSLNSYQQHMSFSFNPLVLFLFDHSPQVVVEFWQPFINSFSLAMEKFGIDVAHTDTTSEVGQKLGEVLGRAPAILFYQGVGDTPVSSDKGLKVPIPYQGGLGLQNITMWALASISPSVVQRVHNDADLARFFALYPKYPNMPRVIFFPTKNYTDAGFLTVSQHFSCDAGFAVVPDAFLHDEATAIARRYGVANATELPVLLVLNKAPAAEDGGVGESDYVVRMNGTTSEWSYAGVKAFLDEQLVDNIEALVAKARATQDAKILAVAEKRRMYMAAALVERQFDVAEEERLRLAVEPVVVKDQAAWAEHCLQLPKGHKCIVVFVDSTLDPAAQTNAARVLSIVSIKLMEMLALEARTVSLVIVERENSDALRSYFDAGQNGYPDVVLISLGRPTRYYNYVGSFSAEGIIQFFASHDPRFAKGEVRGGYAFIPRMAPKLGSPAEHGNDDGGDL
ncbi:hypothetical protein ABL78_4173 [Leptomonas seymouri]|uniref:Thioredoxin domain-containing protein n=1 Tax=Leptomonas seymouri TaxID=5684 RepID=A0A0N0P5Q9_LEPSE|nr:hypothetical protein ABL78_4173 [Leptomonas seymouri]|eukprot:KPI86756.1 hypothetical protein ABL78_4173 [Leptomonas seymouri]